MQSLKIGIIGAGGISTVHASAWAELGAEVSVFSLNGAEELAAVHGFTVSSSLDALLALVDVVDIVTPSATHKQLALAAIAAGKHVICEKPLAPNTEDAVAIVRAANEAGVHLFPAHVVRFFGEYEQIKAAIDGARLGELAVLRFSRGGSAPEMDWFFSEPAGGGLVLDQMIHDLDQAYWLAGDVVQVYATQNPPSRDGIVPRTVVSQLVLSHSSGAISQVQGAWLAPGMPFRTSVDVAGNGGSLGYSAEENRSVRVDRASTEPPAGYLPPVSETESPYYKELREFAEVISGSRTHSRVSAVDGVIAVELAAAAYESIRSGRAVDIDTAALRAAVTESRKVATR